MGYADFFPGEFMHSGLAYLNILHRCNNLLSCLWTESTNCCRKLRILIGTNLLSEQEWTNKIQQLAVRNDAEVVVFTSPVLFSSSAFLVVSRMMRLAKSCGLQAKRDIASGSTRQAILMLLMGSTWWTQKLYAFLFPPFHPFCSSWGRKHDHLILYTFKACHPL